MNKNRLLTVAFFVVTVCGVACAETVTKTLKNSQPGRYIAETKYPQFSEQTPLARLANRTLAQWAKETHRTFERETRESIKEFGKPRAPYESQATYNVGYYDAPRLISVVFDRMEYTGGAHPNSEYVAFNFGVVSGKAKRLTLDDLFRKGANYRSRVSSTVLAKLKKKEGATSVAEGEVKGLTVEQFNRFQIKADGLTFLFNHYEVGPYAAGRFEVKLTFAELGPDFQRSLFRNHR